MKSPIPTLDTLKSCALVSRAFGYRSRTHVFHTVDLVFGPPAGQERAGRLLRILRKKDNRRPVIQSIRQFNLWWWVGNHSAYVLSRKDRSINKLRRFCFHIWKPSFHNNTSPLWTKFSGSWTTHRWPILALLVDTVMSNGRGDIEDVLLRIVTKPSLRSLQLVQIHELPEIYIRNALQTAGLTTMRLRSISFAGGEQLPVPRHNTQPTQFAKLENLEIRFLSYKTLLAITGTTGMDIGTSVPGGPSGSHTLHTHPIYSRIFSRLKHLYFFIPGCPEQLMALWRIVGYLMN